MAESASPVIPEAVEFIELLIKHQASTRQCLGLKVQILQGKKWEALIHLGPESEVTSHAVQDGDLRVSLSQEAKLWPGLSHQPLKPHN